MSCGWREELQGDVVGIAERQARPVWRVHDPTVGDAQLIEASLPLGKLVARRAGEREVVKPRPALVERLGAGRIGELVEPDQCLTADEPDDVPERPGVLVQHRLGTEEPLVPRHAPVEIGHGEGDVGDGRELGHGSPCARRLRQRVPRLGRLVGCEAGSGVGPLSVNLSPVGDRAGGWAMVVPELLTITIRGAGCGAGPDPHGRLSACGSSAASPLWTCAGSPASCRPGGTTRPPTCWPGSGAACGASPAGAGCGWPSGWATAPWWWRSSPRRWLPPSSGWRPASTTARRRSRS